jgi:hypothetical protein
MPHCRNEYVSKGLRRPGTLTESMILVKMRANIWKLLYQLNCYLIIKRLVSCAEVLGTESAMTQTKAPLNQ